MNLTMIGIDLAKAVFQLHGVDDKGRVVMKKQVKRAQMLPFFVLVEGGAPGCCGEPAGRIGRNVHREPNEASSLSDALPLHYQHHRESESRRAPR